MNEANEVAEGPATVRDSVEVELNGRTRTVPPGLSVRGLLEHLELQPELIVVERNLEILDRSSYDEIDIESGDRIELVHFVGGG